MRIIVKTEFKGDYITRAAGENLRLRILDASRRNEIVEIDFTGVIVASTSFFDEGIAKLADEGWTGETLRRNVNFRALNPHDRAVLKRVCEYRGLLAEF